jgi:drug/metabolite transporter (DMT)-like permease
MDKAIALALVASVCTATSSLCQRLGAGTNESAGFDVALLFRLARRPVWLAGIVSMIAGFGFQVTALRYGPLALVQPILVLELPFVFGYLALLGSRRVRLQDWLAVVAMSAGLGLFLLSASPSGGRLHAPGLLWWLAGLASAGAVLLGIAVSFGLGSVGTRLPGIGVFGRGAAGIGARRAAVLGITAGLAWGFEAAVIKEFSSHLGDGAGAVFGNWSVYVLVGAGAASLLLASHALAAGPLAASQPGFTIVDPLVASLLGMFLFGERMQARPIDLAGEAAGLALLVIGVSVLSHSHLIHGEDGLAGAAGPAQRGASESLSARMLILISRLTFTSGLDSGIRREHAWRPARQRWRRARSSTAGARTTNGSRCRTRHSAC